MEGKQQLNVCPACRGQKRIKTPGGDRPCPACQGSGKSGSYIRK